MGFLIHLEDCLPFSYHISPHWARLDHGVDFVALKIQTDIFISENRLSFILKSDSKMLDLTELVSLGDIFLSKRHIK